MASRNSWSLPPCRFHRGHILHPNETDCIQSQVSTRQDWTYDEHNYWIINKTHVCFRVFSVSKSRSGRKTLEKQTCLPIFAAKEVIVPKNTNPATDTVDPTLMAIFQMLITWSRSKKFHRKFLYVGPSQRASDVHQKQKNKNNCCLLQPFFFCRFLRRLKDKVEILQYIINI